MTETEQEEKQEKLELKDTDTHMGLSPTRIRDFLYFTVAIEPVLYIN
jgi:hypothetical protein